MSCSFTLQTIGVASIPLEEAEFIQFPGRSVPLSVDLMKPEAAGIMKMVGGVGKGVQGVGKGGDLGVLAWGRAVPSCV